MNLLGSYIPSSSPLHRMDPTVRIIVFIMLFSSILVASGSLVGYVISSAVIVLFYFIAHVPLIPAIRSFWRFRVFFVTIFLMNAFFQPSPDSYFSWWIVTFSSYGIMTGMKMVMSVLLLTSLSALLTATATPLAITEGLRTLFHPLSFFHIPVDEASSIISMAISLIPVLASESNDILLSARARGAVPEGKKAKEKALSLVPLAVPLFLAAFRRADMLSDAMLARGYSGGRMMKNIHISFGRREAVSLLLAIAILLSAIALKGVSN